MKAQYFGDSRDALKYDFWIAAAAEIARIRVMTFVPMLTPDDGTGQGRHKRYGRARRPDLLEFLKEQGRAKPKSILRLRPFILTTGLIYEAYRESEWFLHDSRESYFAGVDSKLLIDAAVLIDPDVGLQPSSATYMKRSGPTKYVLLREIECLLQRSSGATFFLIYQHLQRNAHRVESDLKAKAVSVAGLTPTASCCFVRNNDVAFLAVSSNPTSAASLEELCGTYSRELGLQHGAVSI